jgi:hypothetical protein
MVFFLAAVVNPSGLEISSAIAAWTAGVVLVTERLAAPPRGLLWVFALSACTFALVRNISPLWVVCMGVFLVGAAPPQSLRAALHDRRIIAALLAVVVAGLGALAWIVPEHALLQYVGTHAGLPKSVSTGTILENAFRHNAYYLPDMVGVFGWFDTYSPLASYVIWGALIGALVVAAVRFGGRRAALLLGALIVLVLLIPVLIVSAHAREYGYNWSGRDTLPLAVGLPLLAAAFVGTRRPASEIARLTRSSVRVVAPLVALAQFLAFYEALRRYAVGTHGAIFGFITHPSWHPAIGIVPALLLELLAVIALAAMVVIIARHGRDALDSAEQTGR